jgi:Zn-finger nucleic acid-binding protein
MQKYRYGKDKNIIVDQCPQCKGLWLDNGELEAIQRAYERWEDFVQAEKGRGDVARPRPVPTKKALAANFARNMSRASLIFLTVKWMLSLIFLFGPAVAIAFVVPEVLGLRFWAIYAAVWLVVLLIAKHVEFCPDTEDLGWFGGWMDDPFSWSDDWNRTLLWWRFVFTIPKFVVKTFEDTLDVAKA